jgi:cytochrome d ubiquinol oxidase subunit II
MTALQVIWYILIGVLLTGYAVLDGFDLGVGFWHLFTRKDQHRRTLMNAIGPVWDGNEVFLVAGGGAIFAAFPHVYATVFSGMYLALMLLLFGLISRAVSLEFRSKQESPRWRRTWDISFAVGSILATLLFGVALGNILRGLPLDASKNFVGTFWGLLNPYALLIGLVGVAMFATHGAVYIAVKTEGELARTAQVWGKAASIIFIYLFIIATVVTMFTQSWLLNNWSAYPFLLIIVFLTFAAMDMVSVYLKRDQANRAFLASCLSIIGLMLIVAISLFPNLVPALQQPEFSLTLTNASSSQRTLLTMLIIAIIGLPLVAVYSFWVHKSFWGKVQAESKVY